MAAEPNAPPQCTNARSAAWQAWLVALAAGAAIAIIASLMAYAHPQADDFSRWAKIKDMGIAAAMQHEYHNWQGRWAGFGGACLASLVPNIESNYSWLLAVLGVLFALSTHLLLCTVLELPLLAARAWALTLTLLAVYCGGMHAPGETLYWFPGATEYHGAMALCMLTAALVVRGARLAAGARALLMPPLMSLAILATGTHELIGLVLCAALLAGTIVTFAAGHRGRWLWLAVLIAAAAGSWFVISADGNAIRSLCWPGRGDALLTARLTAWSVASTLAMWLSDGRLWLATALLWLLPHADAIAPSWLATARRRWRWLAAAWLAALAAMYAAPHWAMGVTMPGRLINTIHFVFLLGWLLAALCVRPAVQSWLARRGPLCARLAAAAVVLWAAAIIFTGNSLAALRDYGGVLQAHDAAMWQRYETLRQGAGRDLVLPPAPQRPGGFYRYGEITPDANHWINRGVADYYGARSVVVKDGG
jgi:hypothetical protein